MKKTLLGQFFYFLFEHFFIFLDKFLVLLYLQLMVFEIFPVDLLKLRTYDYCRYNIVYLFSQGFKR